MADPDLNLLVALDALLAEGSVAGAARRLALSASAMSRTLTRLREATGDPLLVRAGRRMVLTPHAQALRQRTQDAVQEARTMLRPALAETDFSTLRRTFTIRANDGFVAAFGAPLIAAAMERAPHVRLRFAPKPEKTSTPLRDGTADLEIGVLGEMGPEVRVQALFRDRFVGAVRPGHPLLSDATACADSKHEATTSPLRTVSAAQYTAFAHVVASRRGRTHGPVDDALATLGHERTVALVVPGFLSAIAIAQASDLIALVPASLVTLPSTAPSVAVFELPVPTGEITVSQMWHPRLEADPAHRWLRQLTLSVCRNLLTA